MPDKPTIYIGIDPGSTIGVAIWFRKTKELITDQYTCLYEAMQHLDQFCQSETKAGEVLHFIIEDARMVKGNAFFSRKNSSSKDQGVGSVKGQSKEWERFCSFLGLSYELKPPTLTKTTPEYFESLTGLKTLKTHSHRRDAAMIVFGK